MIGVQEVPEPGSVDLAEAGLMLPVPGLQTNSIHFEHRDGSNVETLIAQAVTLQRNGTTVFRCRNVRITVFITDARLALACSKYDKGGGWIGSPTAMIMANTVSKGLAAIRRHGKMLVGQVRYPWLSGVGSTARLGMGSSERLVLEAKTDDATSIRLTLLLPKDIDGSVVAAEVVNRAARYRLAAEPELADEKRTAFEDLANAQPLPAGAKNVIRFHRTPNFYFVKMASAKVAPPEAGGLSTITPAGRLPRGSEAPDPDAHRIGRSDEQPSEISSSLRSIGISGLASGNEETHVPELLKPQPIVITLDDL
jgi:hypothetical protein